MIRRILDLQSDFLLFLLFFLKVCILFLDIQYFLHIQLQIPLKILYGVLSLFIHSFVLGNINIVFVEFRLHFLLGDFKIFLHLLLCIHHFLLKLISLKEQILIWGLLRLIGHFCSLQSPRQFFSLLCHLSLSIISSFVLIPDSGKIFLQDSHGLVEDIVIFLRIVDDFEERFHHSGDLIVLIFSKFALFPEIFDRLCPIFQSHSDQIFLVAHLCITYLNNGTHLHY